MSEAGVIEAYRPAAVLPCRKSGDVKRLLTLLLKSERSGLIDLQKSTWFDPAALVMLMHLAYRMDAAKKRLQYFPPDSQRARTYLDVHFAAAGDTEMTLLLRSLNSYPLRRIGSEKAVVKELGKWREAIVQQAALPDELVRQLASTLAEVLANSFTHGAARAPSIVAGQTFPAAAHVQIASADFGRTIPESLADSEMGPGYAPSEYVVRSLEKGVTRRTKPTNRGLGLYLLKSHVLDNGGSMLLLSGRGLVEISRTGEVLVQDLSLAYDPFPGTLLVVDLPCRQT